MDEGALTSLAAMLWSERRQLERLLYALTVQQSLLTAGQSRWLGHVDADIEAAASALRDAELLRAVEMNAITDKLGVGPDISLAELAEQASEPWTSTLSDHRVALRALTSEIDQTVARNRQLLTAGAKAIGETLAGLTSFSTTYDASGGVRRGDGASFLDEQI